MGGGGHPLNMADLSKATALKKIDLPFPSSYELSIVPLLGVGLVQIITTELENIPTGTIGNRISWG